MSKRVYVLESSGQAAVVRDEGLEGGKEGRRGRGGKEGRRE